VTNALIGVTKGFEKILEIEGVGYRVVVEAKSSCFPWLCPSGASFDSDK